MEISFEELMAQERDGYVSENRSVIEYAIKQLSRCRFNIDGERCVVQVLEENGIDKVVFSNINGLQFIRNYLYLCEDETTVSFMHERLTDQDSTLFDMLSDYKEKNYVKGDSISYKKLFKLYGDTPYAEELRKRYHATKIDYEKQKEEKGYIYDENQLAGLFSMPAEMVPECIKEGSEARDHYGNKMMILEPIPDEYYLDAEKEVVGAKFNVIENLALEKADDVIKLLDYLLMEKERTKNDFLKQKNEQIADKNKELRNAKEDVSVLIDSNVWLQKRNIIFAVGGFLAGMLLMVLCNCIFR